MYAIIKTGGKQYCVEEGKQITIEKLPIAENGEVAFDQVLMVSGDTVKIGQPFVEGAKVTAKVLEQRKLEFSNIKQNLITVVVKVIVSLLQKFRLKRLKDNDYC